MSDRNGAYFINSNLFYLVDNAEYFIHYFRPNGKYITSINQIPDTLEVHCPKIKGLSLNQSEKQCQIFLLYLSNSENRNEEDLFRNLLEKLPIKSIVTFSFYFCAFRIIDQILQLIKEGTTLSFHFLKVFYMQCGMCNTVTDIFNCIYNSELIPCDLRFRPIEFYLFTPSKTLNFLFRKSKRKDDYNRTLVREMCDICHVTETFQFMNFGMFFYKTECCFSNIHKTCFFVTFKNAHFCPICKKNYRNRHLALESSELIVNRQKMIKTRFEIERKKYRGLDLHKYVKRIPYLYVT